MFAQFLISLVVMIGLSGCATTANYEKILNTGVGSPADNLIAPWGPPTSSYPLSDGGTILRYERHGNFVVPSQTYYSPQTTYHSGSVSSYGNYGSYRYGNYQGTSTTYVPQTIPGYTVPLSCNTTFRIDGDGIIRSWQWQGNHCVAILLNRKEVYKLGIFTCQRAKAEQEEENKRIPSFRVEPCPKPWHRAINSKKTSLPTITLISIAPSKLPSMAFILSAVSCRMIAVSCRVGKGHRPLDGFSEPTP
jgi:hypothetical protein